MIYFVSIVALLAFVCYVWSTYVPYSEAMREIERKNRAEEEARRKAWLETPEGQAHQQAQQRATETQHRWAAERIEAERSAAQVERLIQERRLQHRAREQQRLQKVEEETARAEWNAFFESKTIDAIASMTGLEFEKFLARLLPHLAYRDISLTAINDQGGDIL